MGRSSEHLIHLRLPLARRGRTPLIAASLAIYFTRFDDLHGMELWRSDGTAQGTTRVKDLRREGPRGYEQYVGIVGAGGTVFYIANDGRHGPELWRSDGTAQVTTLVKDLELE